MNPAASTSQRRISAPSGRLIDRIASPSDTNPLDANPNKLDYIIEFMRANKLTKFCDLLTSDEPEVRNLTRQLNSLNQFTLFVPTNEALLLLKPSIELVKRAGAQEVKQFLMAHATSELIAPRLQDDNLLRLRLQQANRWASSGSASSRPTIERIQSTSSNLLFSLAGSPLRVTTVPVTSVAGTQTATTRLELIVNGANVLSGNSHALQEPNNSSATYAIVHLIDRSLYPPASLSLFDKIHLAAPKFAKLLQVARDEQLNEQLKSINYQTTALVPNDEAFRTIPSKLLDQLESNQTFVVSFLRHHLVDGIYFSGQLSSSSQQLKKQLSSLAGGDLNFETKQLQSRNLLLVNSIPLLELDSMALNGVLHVISRPLFEKHLLEACHCESESPLSKVSWPTNDIHKLDPLASESSSGEASRPAEQASWFGPGSRPVNTNELEREESQQQQQQSSLVMSNQRVRLQRSGNLVGMNNRNFYRPSTAPVNLQLHADDHLVESGSASSSSSSGVPFIGSQADQSKLFREASTTSNATNDSQMVNGRRGNQLAPINANVLLAPSYQNDWNKSASLNEQSFEVDRYKVVLNATSRQKIREQQQLQTRVQPVPTRQSNQFVYDQPLATSTSTESSIIMSSSKLRQYSPAPIQPINDTLQATDQVSPSASTNRQQRLLKFQPDDAVTTNNRSLLSSNLQAFYDVAPAANQFDERRQQSAGKTVAPGASFGGCAFYDTECKRLVGRLTRLPQMASKSLGAAQQPQLAPNSTIYNFARPAKHLDSTFGETTTMAPQTDFDGSRLASSIQTTPSTFLRGSQSNNRPQLVGSFVGGQPPASVATTGRLSPLNQPLPPWSDEDHLTNSSSSPSGQLVNRIPGTSHWRAQDLADISRIRLASGKLSQSNEDHRARLSAPTTTAQILLVPVKMFQDAAGSMSVPNLRQTNQTSGLSPIYFAPPPPPQASPPVRVSSEQNSVTFVSNSQFHRPTSTASDSDRLNPNNFPARLSNFSAFEPNEDTSGLNGQPSHRQNLVRAPVQNYRKSPIQLMNETYQQQAEGIKQARKLIRQQAFGGGKQPGDEVDESTNSDISITSAKLSGSPSLEHRLRNFTGGGLATQASNQAPNSFISSQSLPLSLGPSASVGSANSVAAGDFFQNRTIAEIMDDSGLRIDGQQVTFNRLRDCLQQADLATLVKQPGNSLSIFMPTDAAFQRLVQHQAILQQRTGASGSSSRSARLTDASKARHLLPLVAKVDRLTDSSAQRARLVTSNSNQLDDQLNNQSSDLSSLTNRLTLDCASPQVRQLLLDHLSAQLITPRQLVADTNLSALSGKRLLLSSVPSKKIVVVDGQPVIAATRTKNGMVYVLNKFLNLTQQVPNVIDLIETQPQLSTFLSYLTFSSLADRLKREAGPITILAPTNEAFEQLSSSARQLINSDPSALLDILRGHVVEGAQFGKLVSMRNKLKTMNTDQSIEAKVIKPNVYQLDNQMTSIRLIGTAGNGVVNSIDRLIVPPWLRVSMGARQTGPVASRSLSGTEVEGTSANLLRQPPLNLPVLNNQPLSFDQPDARLAQPANSFLLSGISSTSAPNNLLDSFDVPSIDGDERIANNNNNLFSQFSRNAPSTTTTTTSTTPSTLPGNRLAFADNNNNGIQASNGTKNMQLIDKLATLMKHKKFVRYLMRSRLSEQLKADMNYVILVPTDQAVEKLPKQIISMLDKDPERLSDLVNYHVLDTTFEYINTIPDGQTLNTLNEKDILFNWHRNNTILTASGAVVLGGIQEENIALLIVDRVLYPTPGDLLSIVSKSPILSNFTQLIRNARLEKQLTLSGPYTLFAPSDIAFNQLEARDLDYLHRNPETARRFLLRHLSQPAIFTSSIALSNTTETSPSSGPKLNVPTLSVTNSLGEDLQLRQRNDYFSVNEVNFSYADVAATNGVMHVIDGLL